MGWLIGLTMLGVVSGSGAASPADPGGERDPRACRCFATGTCDLAPTIATSIGASVAASAGLDRTPPDHRTATTNKVTAMESRPIDVFFYGLFMDPEILRGKGVHPVDSRAAFVSGMALQIGQRAALVPDPGGRVYGFVFGLSQRELDHLYADPSVAAYRPEAVMAELADGSRVPALCYNLPPSAETATANPEYAEKLRAVASRLGLPPDYVAGIR